MPNIPKLIAANLKKYGKSIGVKSCTLISVTPGSRTTGSISAGTNPTTVSRAATGWLEMYSDSQIDGTVITRKDRKISLLGASIAGGVAPKPGDKITIADPNKVVTTYTIVPDGVKSDPVGAVYTCQGRA